MRAWTASSCPTSLIPVNEILLFIITTTTNHAELLSMSKQQIEGSEANPYHVGVVASRPEQSGMSPEFTIFDLLRQFPGIEVEGMSSYGCKIDKLSELARKHRWQEIYTSFLIPDIVLNPIGIWLEPDRTLCVAGFPSGKFAESVHLSNQMTILPGKILVCNLTVQGLASHWGWEIPDSDGTGLPSNHRIHRGKLIWTPNQQHNS